MTYDTKEPRILCSAWCNVRFASQSATSESSAFVAEQLNCNLQNSSYQSAPLSMLLVEVIVVRWSSNSGTG